MEELENLGDLLPTYYARLFPFHDYYRWLSYGNGITINHINVFHINKTNK